MDTAVAIEGILRLHTVNKLLFVHDNVQVDRNVKSQAQVGSHNSRSQKTKSYLGNFPALPATIKMTNNSKAIQDSLDKPNARSLTFNAFASGANGGSVYSASKINSPSMSQEQRQQQQITKLRSILQEALDLLDDDWEEEEGMVW